MGKNGTGPMIDWLFWDNDGVLVETEPLYYRASAAALARVGVELGLEDFCEISLRRGESVFQLAEEQGLGATDLEELRRWRDGHYRELLAEGVAPLPGVIETLEHLAGQVRMAIVTSCRREHFLPMHRSNGLLDYFDFILVREDYRHSKPDPEPYRLALARSGADSVNCLAVEDSERGVRSATDAGLDCVAIPGPLNAGGDFTPARWRLDDVRQLPSLLLPG